MGKLLKDHTNPELMEANTATASNISEALKDLEVGVCFKDDSVTLATAKRLVGHIQDQRLIVQEMKRRPDIPNSWIKQ